MAYRASRASRAYLTNCALCGLSAWSASLQGVRARRALPIRRQARIGVKGHVQACAITIGRARLPAVVGVLILAPNADPVSDTNGGQWLRCTAESAGSSLTAHARQQSERGLQACCGGAGVQPVATPWSRSGRPQPRTSLP